MDTARLKSVKITKIEEPKLGSDIPKRVIAEIEIDLSDLPSDDHRKRFLADIGPGQTTLYLLRLSYSEQ